MIDVRICDPNEGPCEICDGAGLLQPTDPGDVTLRCRCQFSDPAAPSTGSPT